MTAKNGAGAKKLAIQQQEQARLVAEASSASKNQKPDTYAALEAARTGQNLDKSGNKPVMVSITFKAESWMQIEVDGKTEFEGTLPTGTVRTWQADRKLVVVAGNAGGVMIAVNNGQAEQLGQILESPKKLFLKQTNSSLQKSQKLRVIRKSGMENQA